VAHGIRAVRELGDTGIEAITSSLFAALAVRNVAADRDLPDTGVGIPGERILSPPFIAAESYGTRASTVILLDHQGQVMIRERAFGPMGTPAGSAALDFKIESPHASSRAATSNIR
jgi:uncharacterized protein with NRDE domain